MWTAQSCGSGHTTATCSCVAWENHLMVVHFCRRITRKHPTPRNKSKVACLTPVLCCPDDVFKPGVRRFILNCHRGISSASSGTQKHQRLAGKRSMAHQHRMPSHKPCRRPHALPPLQLDKIDSLRPHLLISAHADGSIATLRPYSLPPLQIHAQSRRGVGRVRRKLDMRVRIHMQGGRDNQATG